jgi:oxalate decarboxylase
MEKPSAPKDPAALTRRQMLGLTTSVLAAAGAAAASLGVGVPSARAIPHPGAQHVPLENFVHDLEAGAGWVGPGGSAKESTVAELPIARSIAGVSMRLQAGGLRELHWHAIAAEWAYVIKGNVRTTVIAPNGQAEQDDFGPGDVWYFPKGHGHALQGLGPGETHFILGFDDGNFSEFGTFSVTDWLARTPGHVLERNLRLPAAAFAAFPKSESYITQGKVPPARPAPLRNARLETSQVAHKYRLDAAPATEFEGGDLRVVSQKEFPISSTLTGARMNLKPGALREMHWHPNADEWQFYLSGRARVTIFGAHGRVLTREVGPGQVAFIPQGFGHFVEQIGPETTQVLILFNSPAYEEISLSTWLGANPAAMLADNFGVSEAAIRDLPARYQGIIGS